MRARRGSAATAAAFLALAPAMTWASSGLQDTGRICVADLGSNSLKLEIGEVRGGDYVQHYLRKKVVGVGDDMSETGRISQGKLAELDGILKGFGKICAAQRTLRRLGVATAAYREASNGNAVIDRELGAGKVAELALR